MWEPYTNKKGAVVSEGTAVKEELNEDEVMMAK
jgi:hypothetical protein